MKRLLTVFFLMVSIYGFGQVPSNYLNIRSRYNLIAVKTDSGFHVPGYSTIPNYRGGVWSGAGNIGVDTVNNKFYFYSGGQWREAGSSYTFTNGITESGGTVKLGGELIEQTTISGQEPLTFSVSNNHGGQIIIDDGEVHINAIKNINGNASKIKVHIDSINILPPNGKLYVDSLNATLSTTGKKIMLRDTATGLVQNIDPSLISGGSASGNYGNVQLNRNGVFSTPSSDSLTFSDKLNVKGNIIGTNKLILGATSAPAQSQIYVTGGLTGGNIDARGDSSSAQKDEANIEVQHADYDGSSFTGYGVALQANGNVSSGTLLGYSNKNSAQLRFTGDVNVIRTLTNRSLRFGVNNVEKLVLDSIGRVGIGVINPDSTLHVNGSFKLVNGTQGTGKVLTSDANGGASWKTPANSLTVGDLDGASSTDGASIINDTLYMQLFGSEVPGLVPSSPMNITHYLRADGNWVEPSIIDSIWRVVGKDSIFWRRNNITYALKDSTGGGSSGLTIGTTTITGSATGSILYDSVGVLRRNDKLFWDRTSNVLRIGGTLSENPTIKFTSTDNSFSTDFSIYRRPNASPSPRGLTFYNDGSGDVMTLARPGKVGILTTDPTSSLTVAGSFEVGYAAKSADYTLTDTDCVIEVTATGKTLTLPTAVGCSGRQYTIKLTASGTGTVATTSSQTIDGSTTYSLSAQYKYVTVVSNNANWIITANN